MGSHTNFAAAGVERMTSQTQHLPFKNTSRTNIFHTSHANISCAKNAHRENACPHRPDKTKYARNMQLRKSYRRGVAKTKIDLSHVPFENTHIEIVLLYLPYKSTAHTNHAAEGWLLEKPN